MNIDDWMNEYEKDPMRSILLGIINETEAIRQNVQKLEEQNQRILEQNMGILEQNQGIVAQTDQLRELVLVTRNEWQETKKWMRAPFWKRWFGLV